jgi:hypothetical protein
VPDASGTIALVPTGTNQSLPTKYVAEIRNGTVVSASSNTVTVTHSLSSTDVIVQIYDTTGTGTAAVNQIFADVVVTSSSAVTVTFGSTDTLYYRVVVIG